MLVGYPRGLSGMEKCGGARAKQKISKRGGETCGAIIGAMKEREKNVVSKQPRKMPRKFFSVVSTLYFTTTVQYTRNQHEA